MPLSPALLEHAAQQSGFDLDRDAPVPWRSFSSSRAPLRVWLRGEPDDALLAALSMGNVDAALDREGHGLPWAGELPAGAVAVRRVADRPALRHLLRRAWQLSATLPDELLHAFEKQTASMPRSTEAQRLVVQRVGQDLFRGGLLDYWEGRCAVTGLAVTGLLRASHIKPWAACTADAQRLDVFNGLLLAPQWDAAFDGGWVTVAEDGAVVLSTALDAAARRALGLDTGATVRRLEARHHPYLAWHRARVWRG